MMSHAFVVPWRNRGRDPLRLANLTYVVKYLESLELGPVHIVSDGRDADSNFCRGAAYNIGVARADADVTVFYEADMIVARQQLADAIALAATPLGLVLPFTLQHKLSPADSVLVRAGLKDSADCTPDRHPYGESGNTGCVNVLSRETLDAVGQWDEVMDGHGHDDTAMFHAFAVCAGPPRWVDGSAYHLYHLDSDPDTAPDRSHLTAEDKAAQARNRQRLQMYRGTETGEGIRRLTAGETAVGSHDWRARWAGKNEPFRSGR